MIAFYLRRGMAAGLLAGLLAGLFAFVVGESLLDRDWVGGNRPAGEPQFCRSHAGWWRERPRRRGRGLQRIHPEGGLFFATGLSGTFVGGLFGVTFAFFRERLASRSDWGRSMSLAAAISAGAALIPFLKYPANPPTVGDPATIGLRTEAYFMMVALSLLAVLTAWYAAHRLRERGMELPVRHLAVGLVFACVVAVLFGGLPATADPGEFPAGLLWNFQISSIGTQLVLWTGLGVVFGLLCERANRKNGAA